MHRHRSAAALGHAVAAAVATLRTDRQARLQQPPELRRPAARDDAQLAEQVVARRSPAARRCSGRRRWPHPPAGEAPLEPALVGLRGATPAALSAARRANRSSSRSVPRGGRSAARRHRSIRRCRRTCGAGSAARSALRSRLEAARRRRRTCGGRAPRRRVVADEMPVAPGSPPCPGRAAGRPVAAPGRSDRQRVGRAQRVVERIARQRLGLGHAAQRGQLRQQRPAAAPGAPSARRRSEGGLAAARMRSSSSRTRSPESAGGRRCQATDGGLGGRIDAQRRSRVAKRTARTRRSASSANRSFGSPTARSTPRCRSPRPPNGSTSRPRPASSSVGTPGHGVDREVAPRQVLVQGAAPAHLVGPPPVAVRPLVAVGGHLHSSPGDRAPSPFRSGSPTSSPGRARPPARVGPRWPRPSRPVTCHAARSRTLPPTRAASWPASARRESTARTGAGRSICRLSRRASLRPPAGSCGRPQPARAGRSGRGSCARRRCARRLRYVP